MAIPENTKNETCIYYKLGSYITSIFGRSDALFARAHYNLLDVCKNDGRF